MKKICRLLTIFLIFTFMALLPPLQTANLPPGQQILSCLASTTLPDGHNNIDKARVIHRNTSYKATAAPNTFHYYCLLGQERDGDIIVKISSQKNLSVSFQLFDKDGSLCPPSNYIFDPVNHKLQINYHIRANRSYLLGLYNSMKTSSSYTIRYEDANPPTMQTPTPKPTKKPTPKPTTKPTKKTNKKTTKKTSKKVTPKPVQSTPAPTKSPKPVQNTPVPTKSQKQKQTAPKQKKNTVRRRQNAPVPQLKLSHTFLQIKAGQSFSVRASVTPKQSCRLQWEISPSHLIKKKNSKKTADGGTLYATAAGKGTLIITCKRKGKAATSASCTVKVK